jgi:hypothetical protein
MEQHNGYFKLNNDSTFMSLTIEKLVENTFSLCHYGEQNGDLMRFPEMIFWKNNDGDYFPIYYRNDYVGVEQFSGKIINNRPIILNEKQQRDQTQFSNVWMKNIKYQQNL